MKVQIDEKLNLLKNDYIEASIFFGADINVLNYFVALGSAIRNLGVNGVRIREVRDYIKENTGLLSKLRSHNLSMLSLYLAFEYDYKESFEEVRKGIDKLKEKDIKDCYYAPIMSYEILKNTNAENREVIFERTRQLCEEIKNNHKILGSGNDYVYASVLACSDVEVDKIIDRIEHIYNRLKDMKYSKRDGLLLSSCILALSDDSESRIKLLNKMVFELEKNDIKIKIEILPYIVIMALITNEASDICNDVIEVYEELKKSKGFKLGLKKNLKIILSCILVSSVYAEEKNNLDKTSKIVAMDLVEVANMQAMMTAANVAEVKKGRSSFTIAY